MRVTINLPESVVAQIDARDHGKGRSEVITRLLLRYFQLIQWSLRIAPPLQKTLDLIVKAVRHGVGQGEAEALTEDMLQRLALLDAAERSAVAIERVEEDR